MTSTWHELVEDARWAPSPHNTQPWVVHPLSERAAELYAPADRLLPVEDPDELAISVRRVHTTSPKLRYNLHDLGCVVRFAAVERALAGLGRRPEELAGGYLDLPLLFHYGRSDATVAFYGAKITPADLQEVVYSLPELAARVSAFALLLDEDEEANKRLAFAFELGEGAFAPDDVEGIRAQVLARLAAVNQDYREVSRFVPAGLEPTVEFHPAGTGPFDCYDVRLKRAYVRTLA